MEKLLLTDLTSCYNMTFDFGTTKVILKISIKFSGGKLSRFYIFIIRAVLGIVIAVFLTRMFYGRVDFVYVAGLAIFMVGLAYVLEYWRKKKQSESNTGEHLG